MRKFFGPFLAVAIMLAQIPSAQAQTVFVDRSFSFSGLSFDGRGGGIKVRFRLFESEGVIVVCGAYARRGHGVTSRAGREFMRDANINLDGRTILRNLQFFEGVSGSYWDTDLDGAEATCRATSTPFTGQSLRSAMIEFPDRVRVRR